MKESELIELIKECINEEKELMNEASIRNLKKAIRTLHTKCASALSASDIDMDMILDIEEAYNKFYDLVK